MTKRLPTLFIPHGGGPCFFMDWSPGYPRAMWDDMADFLRGLSATLPAKPKAVLVISGHWETSEPTVLLSERPSLLYDYSGFPEHTYHLDYPVPGAPGVAERVVALLAEADISCGTERKRGLDHGVFVPFLLIYPEADVPMTQLSLPIGATVDELLAMGGALAPLRDEGVLIVGSGMTYHNIPGILGRIADQADVAAGFDAWLGAAVTESDITARDASLARWEKAPFARQCHPTAEHLLPLFVAAGAGDRDAAARIYNAPTLGNVQSAFRFGVAA